MLTTALLLTLAATPAVSPAFLGDAAPRRIHLVQDAPPAPPAAEQAPDFSRWTRAQLRAEIERLDATRPSLGLPIGLMAGGGGGALVSAYVLLLSLAGNSRTLLPLFIFLGIAGTVCVGLLVLGGIFLSQALPERRVIGARMDAIDAQLNSETDPRELPPPPPVQQPQTPDDYVVPPPPSLPPEQVRVLPSFRIVLARF